MASGLYIGGGPPLGLPIVTELNASDYLVADVSAGQNARAISVTNFLAQVSEDTIGSGGAALTTGKIPKAIAASPWLADSILVEDTAMIGVGGTPLLKLDVLGGSAKANTAALQYLFSVRSTDAADPLRMRLGIKTDATGGNRYVAIEGDDAGTKRTLVLQPATGNVGFGISAAQAKAHIYTGTSGMTSFTQGQALILEGNGNTFLQFTSPNTSLSGIYWGDDASNTRGGMFYSHTTDSFRIDTAGSQRIQVDSVGNLGLGTTTFGSGAVKVFALSNGTEPAALADTVQMLAKDIVAGNSAPHFVTEAGPVIRLYQQAHIADPAGGGTIDAEARTAINAILVAIENTRLLATS